MPNPLIIILHIGVFIVLAPLISGLISKIKNNLRMRRGQSLLQPYYNLAKLFSKGEVIADTASWIFRAAPFAVFASALCAALFVPVFMAAAPLPGVGDFLALIFIFALGRFFLALAALDTASSFGGMGSSREMFISALAEPALCMAVFAIFLRCGTTDIPSIFASCGVSVSGLAAALALFLVAIAETSRMPLDNQETHLELTMVHEAMVLEYSGRRLALIEAASYIKQLVLFLLIAQIIFPVTPEYRAAPAQIFLSLAWYFGRLIIIAAAVALLEVSVAKMRLFRAADFLGFAFVTGIIASLCAILGI